MRAWGVDNVPRCGGALLVSNHQSFLDPPFVGSPVQRPLYYMARRSLFDAPCRGWLLRAVGAFAVDRDGADRQAMRTAVGLMRRGEALALFPEGTRTPDGEVKPFRPGFVLLAARAQVPIVPVAIHGAFEAWPRHRALPLPGRVHVAYGAPLAAPDGDRETWRAFAEHVRARVVALKDELEQKQ